MGRAQRFNARFIRRKHYAFAGFSITSLQSRRVLARRDRDTALSIDKCTNWPARRLQNVPSGIQCFLSFHRAEDEASSRRDAASIGARSPRRQGVWGKQTNQSRVPQRTRALMDDPGRTTGVRSGRCAGSKRSRQMCYHASRIQRRGHEEMALSSHQQGTKWQFALRSSRSRP